MTDFNYKEYSLSKLSEWIHDCISSGEASPHEIYSTIRNAVREDYNIYKEREQNCLGLLELLSGHRPVNFDTYEWTKDNVLKEREYYESSMSPTPKKWILPVEIDAASGEYYLTLPDDLLDSIGWKEGDTLQYVDNKDGTFSVRKVTTPLKADEC